MHADLQHALIRRIHAHLTAHTTDTSGDGPTTLPVARYLDAALPVFRKRPTAIGHGSQVPNPGDFLTHEGPAGPLLIVRQDDGSLVANMNVCRHRGTRLETAPCGAKKAFVCPYHAWSYARDGRLLGIPHQDTGFAGLDRTELSLARVDVAERAGFIFVNAGDIDANLGPYAAELAGFGTEAAHVYAPRVVTKNLSWKLAIDVFLETYHLRSAHKDTIYRLFFDNVGLVDKHGAHLRTAFPKRTIRDLPIDPDASWQIRAHANVLYHLFPNTLALVQPDHVSVFHAWPVGTAQTRIESYTLVPEPPASDKAKRHWDANNAILYEAVDEDLALGESIQKGLTSGANTHVQFGAFEHALAHFHDEIESALAAIDRDDRHTVFA